MIVEYTLEPNQPAFSNLSNLTTGLAKLDKQDTILSHENKKALSPFYHKKYFW